MASTAPEGKKGSPVAVVAGGAGFLGSHLSEALLAQGFRVIVLDNYTTGRETNLQSVLGHRDFSYKVGDINSGLPNLPRVDYIFHLAGVEEYINGTDVSVETLLVNSIGTKNLLELARVSQAKITLVSSVDLYSGILSSLSLKNYFGISRRDEERFSHHEAKRYAEALTTEYFKKYGVNARIVRLADVYGPRMDLRAGTEMAELLAESLQPDIKKLTIRGEGLKVLHPTYVSDVVYGLIKAATGEGTNGKIFNIVNSEPQTVLNFASRLHQVAPTHPELSFTTDYVETRLPDHGIDFEQTTRNLGWRAVIGLEEGLKRTLAYFREGKLVPELPHPELRPEPVIPLHLPREYHAALQHFSAGPRFKNVLRFLPRRNSPGKPSRPFGLKAILAVMIVFILLSVLVPAGGAVFYSGFGVWRLRGSEGAILAGQADPAFTAAASAENAFNKANVELDELSALAEFFQWSGLDNYRHILTAAEESAAAAKDASTAMKPLLGLGQSLAATDVTLQISADVTRQDLTEVSTKLQLAARHLGSAQGELDQVSAQSLPGQLAPLLSEVKGKLASVQGLLARAQAGVGVLPEVLGLNGVRNYLLLFTNSNELRPVGGFIGSYGVARFEDGRLRDLAVNDTYSLDGQATSTIAAPAPLRDYLGVAKLGLRDSNWSPDFPTDAKLARDLYFQAAHRRVDGVISIDLVTVQNLLRVVGPISMADYNEVITADNFFERAQFHADAVFFAGSTGKKDFLGAAARIILDKILRSPAKGWAALARAVQTSLNEKHLVIYSADAAVQGLLAQSHWDGGLTGAGPVAGAASNRVEDYLLVTDANVGGNKANYFVKNQTNYRVEADRDGGLTAQLTLLYDHTATTETWPSGRYRDYLRVYAPLGSRLLGAEVSDTTQVPVVSTGTELGRTVFSLLFELSSQSKKTIVLTYKLPAKLPSIVQPSQYHLVVGKQAGQNEPPLSVNFDVPTFLKASPSLGTNLSPYSTRLSTNLRRDLDLVITTTP